MVRKNVEKTNNFVISNNFCIFAALKKLFSKMKDINILNINNPIVSSDLVLLWLLQFSNEKYANNEKDMNYVSRMLVKFIVQKAIPEYNKEIVQINAAVNYGEINLFAELNNEIILISMNRPDLDAETKIELYEKLHILYSSERNNRLLVKLHYPRKNDSPAFLQKIKEMGWTIITKEQYIEFIQQYRDLIIANVLDKILED